MKHPLSIGFILLVQTLISCLINGLNLNSFWFSYILFITFVGGILVLFIYVASVASNEKFKFSFNLILIFSVLIFIFILILILIDRNIFFFINSSCEILSYEFKINLDVKEIFSIIKIFNYPFFRITLITIIHLIVTIISIVKITNINEGPLRSKN